MHGAKVYLTARTEEKGKAAIDELRLLTGKEAQFLKLDLSKFDSIEAAVKDFVRYSI